MLALWRPFNTVFSREFDDLFGGREDNRQSIGFTPAVDIEEKENSIVLSADLPGVNEKDIEVKVEDGKLLISGKRKHETEEKNKEGYYRERSYGSFFRQFNFGPRVDPSKIEASYKNGVLTVTVPKKEEAQPKQITISTN